LGASGVQMATRFVLSEECDVADEYKQIYLNAKEEDVIIIKSPVGMPGRALRNDFIEMVEKDADDLEPEECDACLKNCSGDYCILQALTNAKNGLVQQGVVFVGKNVFKIKKILPVSAIFDEILAEYAAVQ
ncbi:MAG: nitronate monooxygenase, partial [Clostridiaceae bacterium]